MFPQEGFPELWILKRVIPCNRFLWKHTEWWSSNFRTLFFFCFHPILEAFSPDSNTSSVFFFFSPSGQLISLSTTFLVSLFYHFLKNTQSEQNGMLSQPYFFFFFFFFSLFCFHFLLGSVAEGHTFFFCLTMGHHVAYWLGIHQANKQDFPGLIPLLA